MTLLRLLCLMTFILESLSGILATAQLEPVIVDVFHLTSFKYQCSAPNATNFVWLLRSSDTPAEYLTLDDSNVAQDEQGGLYFSYITFKDQKHPRWYYVCYAGNNAAQEVVVLLGINVKPNGELKTYIPSTEMYSNSGVLLAAKGSSITLYCIFGGYPEYLITPTWFKLHSQLALNRTYYGRYHTKAITINDLQHWDAGEYTCKIPDRNVEKKFQIVVFDEEVD